MKRKKKQKITKDRRITYKLYPTKKQVKKLLRIFNAQRWLYNSSLEQKITAFKERGISISFTKQCHELTLLRNGSPCEPEDFDWISEYFASFNAQSEQVTLRRLDLAFDAFYQRVKDGEEAPGFPRFKSFDRFSGWGYKAHGDGWKFFPGPDQGRRKMVNGSLYLSGVGNIKMRGSSRNSGTPQTCDIMKKGDNWYVSVVIDCQPERTLNKDAQAGGYDWGTDKFATIMFEDGSYDEIENPRFTKNSAKKLAKEQKKLSKKVKGSNNRKKQRKIVAQIYRKTANKRLDFLHKESNNLVKRMNLIATEELDLKELIESIALRENMTAAQKKGLRREILSTGAGMFTNFVNYKAEEAGSKKVNIPTKEIKPSQTCSHCGRQVYKPLDQREHVCPCGHTNTRDRESCWVCLSYAFTGKGWGWKPALKRVDCNLEEDKLHGQELTICGVGVLLPSKMQEARRVEASPRPAALESPPIIRTRI